MGLVVDCDGLEQGTEYLERVAKDAMQWGSDKKVEFEVGKPEILISSRRRRALRAAKLYLNLGSYRSLCSPKSRSASEGVSIPTRR